MKKILIPLLALMGLIPAKAQQPLETSEMVGITPVLCNNVQLPADARNSMSNKLLQMVTQNGFGSTSGRFSLTPAIVVVDKQAMPGSPTQYVVELEITVYVLDAVEEAIFDQMTFTVKGVDRLENKAFIQAVNQFNPRSAQVRRFMSNVRDKIIDYYATRIPAFITKAETLAEAGRADEALELLFDIPDFLDEYPLVADRIVWIAQNYPTAVEETEATPDYVEKTEITISTTSSTSESVNGVNTRKLISKYDTNLRSQRTVAATNAWFDRRFK